MNHIGLRAFSQSARQKAAPRFTKTLSEASKPPLQKPHVILRPFGLEEAKLLNKKSFDIASLNVKELLFDKELKEARQAQLDYEIKHSPFYESKSFTNTNGKIFTPPVSYFRNDKAKYFPDFVGNTLVHRNQQFSSLLSEHISIVRIYSTISGEKCADTYFKNATKNYLTKDYMEFQEEFPHSQIVDINIPQNWLKGFFVKLSQGNIRKLVHSARHDKYFIVPTRVFPFDVKEALLCDNACSGYIYIVDREGKIRWATSGYANDEEIKIMRKCLKGLENEMLQSTE